MRPEDHHTLKTLVQAAACGVSADNGQPWTFRWRDSSLHLNLDSSRAQSFFDRKQFAALFGLGSVLENLTIAAAHFGYTAEVQFLDRRPDHAAPLLAQVRLSKGGSGPDPLYPEIFRRSTNRRPYNATPVPVEVRAALTATFRSTSSFRLLLIDQREQITHLASLIAAADRIRFDFSSHEIHEDFFGCLRFTKEEAEATGDGLWIQCLEVKPPDRLALQFLGVWRVARLARYLGVAHLFAHQTIALLRQTPLIALPIGRSEARSRNFSEGTPPTDDLFLQGGRLCQNVWLKATSYGLACQPMAVLPLFFAQHVMFGKEGFPGQTGDVLGRLKDDLHATFGLGADEHLLMVLRLGYAPPPSARSFRRPLDEMLTIDDDSPLISA